VDRHGLGRHQRKGDLQGARGQTIQPVRRVSGLIDELPRRIGRPARRAGDEVEKVAGLLGQPADLVERREIDRLSRRTCANSDRLPICTAFA
jgi:hypothetical protein